MLLNSFLCQMERQLFFLSVKAWWVWLCFIIRCAVLSPLFFPDEDDSDDDEDSENDNNDGNERQN